MGIVDHPPLNKSQIDEPQALRICIYQDADVHDERVREMIGAISKRLAPLGIRVEVPWIRHWKRHSFTEEGIVKDVAMHPLECPCDRILAIVGRDFGDFLWGMLMPEYFGAVEDVTFTKGYAVGAWGSLNQVLSMESPTEIAVHEAFHFLGCGHELTADPCLAQVDRLLSAALKSDLSVAGMRNGVSPACG